MARARRLSARNRFADPPPPQKCPECGHVPHPDGTCPTQGCSCTSSAAPADGTPDGQPAKSAPPANKASARRGKLAEDPPPAGGNGDVAPGGDDTQPDAGDPSTLAPQLDDVLDGIQDTLAGAGDLTPHWEQALALVNAADTSVDQLRQVLGVPDSDEDGTPPSDADANALAASADASIDAAIAAVDGEDDVAGVVAQLQQAADLSGQLLDAMGVDDPDDDSGYSSRAAGTFAEGDGEPGEPGGDASADPQRFEVPVMVLEGVDTGDGRYIQPQALTWRELPIPLMAITKTTMGHDDAEVVGRIETVERIDASGLVNPKTGDNYGNVDVTDSETGEVSSVPCQALRAEGTFTSLDNAATVAQLIADGFLTGISVDLSDMSSDIEIVDDGEEGSGAGDEEDLIDALFFGGEMREVVTSGRVMGATVCPFPAFEGAYIQVGGDSTQRTPAVQASCRPSESWAIRVVDEYGARVCVPCGESGRPLVASAGPMEPPKSWFEDPELSGPTPITVTPDGRIYGHLAEWGTCHTGMSGRCVTPPQSKADYAYFRTGSVLTAEGDLVPVGNITMGTGHAPTQGSRIGWQDTLAHYDNTGTAVADVAAGEDAFGIWVAGAMRPDVSELQVRALRASALSGDWRMVGRNLELVAALAVNSPGYPVVRAHVASGATLALVAAGSRSVMRKAEANHEQVAELLAWKNQVEPIVASLLDDRAAQLRERVHGVG